MCDLPSQTTRCPLAILGKRQQFFFFFLNYKVYIRSLERWWWHNLLTHQVGTFCILPFILHFFFSFLIFLFQSLFTFDWLVLVVWVKQHAITHVPSPQETFLVGRLILTSGSYRITFIGWVFSGLWTSLTMNCLVLLGAQR